jgi:hypothetical protein
VLQQKINISYYKKPIIGAGRRPVSAEVFCSKVNFYAAFRKFIGKTPVKYLADIQNKSKLK